MTLINDKRDGSSLNNVFDKSLLTRLPITLIDEESERLMDKNEQDHDLKLVTQAQSGDVAAVGQLFDKHYRMIFHYFYARVEQRQQAEDLAGELFTRMVRHLPSFEPTGVPFRAWLFRIAYNLTMDHFRVANGKALDPLDEAADQAQPGPNPAQQVERQMALEHLQDALKRLVPDQRQVIILRFLSGLSLQETADVMERSLSATKAMQHRALKIMRALLLHVEL